MKEFVKYLLLGFFFWIIIEWATVFQTNVGEWMNYFPGILLFYLPYPLIFGYLIYNRKWSNKKIFFATIIAAFIIEILITRNELLYQWPVMLAAIPVVIAIYSFLTFVPKWAIEGEIQENLITIIPMFVIIIIISVSTYAKGSGLA